MMKGNVSSCLINVTPIFLSLIYFGGLDIFMGEKILAKGSLLTLLADIFCVIALFACLSMRSKLPSLQMSKVLLRQKVIFSITLVLLVISALTLYPDSSAAISSGVFIITFVSFLSLFIVLKGLGGRLKTGGLLPENSEYHRAISHVSQDLVNPSTGLPMIGGVSGMDVSGNAWGTNYNEPSSSYDANRGY